MRQRHEAVSTTGSPTRTRPPGRRLVGIDLGIASRHSVRVLEADGRMVCRASCVPTVESLAAVERAALAGAPAGTRLAVVFEPTGPAWRHGPAKPARPTARASQ
jgi:hypothetical protein